jgi:hypothetical protein
MRLLLLTLALVAPAWAGDYEDRVNQAEQSRYRAAVLAEEPRPLPPVEVLAPRRTDELPPLPAGGQVQEEDR